MKYNNIPFVGQHSVEPYMPDWGFRSCGVAGLLMILRYFDKAHGVSLDILVKKGIEIGAYAEGDGWRHSGLANLAKVYGCAQSHNVDPLAGNPDMPAQEVLEMLLGELRRGPVLASLYFSMNPPAGGHIVVVTGFEEGVVYFSDPKVLTEEAGRRSLPLAEFLLWFKRRYIVIR